MPMIQGLQVSAPRSYPEPDGSIGDRALASRARARRRWVIHSALTLLLTAATLCIVVAWRRDRATVDQQLRALEPAVAAFRQNIRTYKRLPHNSLLPKIDNCQYPRDEERYYAINTAKPAIVAWTKRPVHLMLRSNGYAVIVYEKTPFSIPLELEHELNRGGVVSKRLRSALSEHGLKLSSRATIPIREDGRLWRISDSGSWCTIVKEGPTEGDTTETLSVYGHEGKVYTEWLTSVQFHKRRNQQRDRMRELDIQIHRRPPDP